jgi:hypothetical protein
MYKHELRNIQYEYPEDNEFILVAEGVDEKEINDLMKKWKTSNQNHAKSVFKNNNLEEYEYQRLMDDWHIMRSTEDYKEYKKAFNDLCDFCHIVPKGTIICKCEIKSGKTDNTNSIYLEYSENTKKIKLPEGLKLYHISKVAGIKELIPAFRGKSVKGYLYDKPRVYFTIHKKMPKFLADYKSSTKITYYEAQQEIKEAFIDPLVWGKLYGAIYIETTHPVPVKEVSGGLSGAVKDVAKKIMPGKD